MGTSGESYQQRRCPAKDTFTCIHRRLVDTGNVSSVTSDHGWGGGGEGKFAWKTRSWRIGVWYDLERPGNFDNKTGNHSRRCFASECIERFFGIGFTINVTSSELRPSRKLITLNEPYFVNGICSSAFHIILISLYFSRIEAKFSREEIENLHHNHQLANKNPHATSQLRNKQQLTLNVWVGIIRDYSIGPGCLPPRLNSCIYTNFLEIGLRALLDYVPLETHRQMWFMHDGIAQDSLNTRYPSRSIGRRGTTAWPARSPDLSLVDISNI